MTPQLALRISVAAHWLFVFLSVAASLLLQGFLPDQLQLFLESEEARDLRLFEILCLFGGLITLVGFLAASIGLMFLQRWARWLYVGSLAAGMVFMSFLGPTVEHALTYFVSEISVILSGVVMGICFFGGAIPAARRPQPERL